MADVSKRFAKGSISSGSTPIIYTVPASKRGFVKAMTLCNLSSGPNKVTLTLAGTQVIYDYEIGGNDTLTIPFLDQILEAGETITIKVTAPSSVTYYISGREVDA